jgi:hypothetical protein
MAESYESACARASQTPDTILRVSFEPPGAVATFEILCREPYIAGAGAHSSMGRSVGQRARFREQRSVHRKGVTPREQIEGRQRSKRSTKNYF